MNETAVAPAPLRRVVAARVAFAALLALGLVAALGLREHWPVARELVLARGTGWVALAALLLSLSTTPLSRALGRLRRSSSAAPTFAITRRALGMTAAWLALAHALVALTGTLAGNFGALPGSPHLRAGLTALGVLLVLLLTSFARVVSLLRLRLWKELHRLAYPAAFLALQHVLLSPFAPRTLTLALFGTALLVTLLRLL
ncbi:MAG: ferric reductase-like transmembrane domain-containing protein [Polyangiales bacterium]